ncbi:TPA: hypothetical protein U1B14_002021 [Streptococcus suis]|uniref:hypothetical protein n=1 Tax=Streptococcus suis TaxID=1307 RepID=UPI00209AE2DB|nr:hypothetical protein [Streptococcus suis]MCO8207910.1 hypothetical protein [Streptococcus suis]MCO8212332.1 hypothetical protein [Streptococcus suis]MCO8212471.1 hypothetical protein [Streptococcus suis]HEM3492595.1 hypothetical protein [Streptococcus suis]HEM3494886.1 hypothetical protein [Streptococcus suis]
MKIITTSQEIISKIESSTSGFPLSLRIAEALVEVEKDGNVVKFRMRELDDRAKKEHVKLMKVIADNDSYSVADQERLDNFGRAFTLSDLTNNEMAELNDFYNEIINHFKK